MSLGGQQQKPCGQTQGLPDERTDGIKEANICFFASFAYVLDNVDAGKS